MAQQYRDKVNFVTIYTIEAHPKSPFNSPRKGKPWPLSYSTYGQAYNWQDRVTHAKAAAAQAGDFLMLVDPLTPQNTTLGNDPMWCTYGCMPNSALLLGVNGTVAFSQTWFDDVDMKQAIQKLLGE